MSRNITNEICAEKRVTKSGRSYVLNVTRELKLMGLQPGDMVGITLRHCESEEDGKTGIDELQGE